MEIMETERTSVLVVDDEEVIRELLDAVLAGAGFIPVLTRDGEGALRILERETFKVIIVDVMLPTINGFEVMEKALQASEDTQVIVLTGNPSVASAREALRLGACDYLMKPVGTGELIATVERAIERRNVLVQNKKLLAVLKERNRSLEHTSEKLELAREKLCRAARLASLGSVSVDVADKINDTLSLVSAKIQILEKKFGLNEAPCGKQHGPADANGEFPKHFGAVKHGVAQLQVLNTKFLAFAHKALHEDEPSQRESGRGEEKGYNGITLHDIRGEKHENTGC